MARIVILITTFVVVLYLTGIFPWVTRESKKALLNVIRNLLVNYGPEYLISTNDIPEEEVLDGVGDMEKIKVLG